MTSAARVDVPYTGVPYQRSAPVLTFALHGLPISQGSKSFKGISRSGRAIMVESSKALTPWRTSVQTVIEATIRRTPYNVLTGGVPFLGPIAVELCFTMRKPVGAPKTRRTWPIVYPDVDKCSRAVLDAATLAGLWGDDSQVVDLHAWKVYPLETPRALSQPGLHATVYLIDPQGPAAGEQARLPAFDHLLRDPVEQFDKGSELLPHVINYLGGLPQPAAAALSKSIEEYRNAPSGTASAPREENRSRPETEMTP